ncbi:MAG: YihA family ribosome biogenesis GTP-binding protein [Deltaproteobacteria bacterium]|nr:YihA family ribosome biogenesis GTP-binding protein [Deltaproteobacteria bacterium]MBW1952260.1 YihA family ribosome biogenesis GTP-binding protein [Deltaproteobacteria bacterium]MBW1986028.1 YihA family ribosome biogenesis GTP-binding protein [Deltaproteobacteria bacterium]MBW2133967.1 YihA family ribosome biogenesis GTP-binding protein [Deltaproteobacteria bacterium]
MAIPKITSAQFRLSAHTPRQFPAEDYPEVAFLGRSNVGKSSLLNTLLHRKRLVRTSSRPGCTQSINFFLINRCWSFVDLPGYGYAQVPLAVKARWLRLVQIYLEQRRQLVAVVFLMDCRRLPGAEEMELLQKLERLQRPVIVVLTKADKLKTSQRARQLRNHVARLQGLKIDPAELIWFSAITREGRQELWTRLLTLINPGR